MPRKISQRKPSLLAPAGDLLKSLSNAESRLRRRVFRIGLLCVVVLFAYSLVFGSYSLPRIARLQMKKHALIETNRRLATELIDTDRTRHLLQTDPCYIEQVARTRYYMVHPDDIVYRYRTR
ncbi:MAG: septum formation initiator family protein [candidate division Zixibacteria bacterium]|nr:septum formation initiator family protein [candidate division Zixibacteria bacterium]